MDLAEPATRTTLLAMAAGLVIPLVEMVKAAFRMPSRYAPLVSLGLGLLSAFAVVWAFPEPPQHPVVTAVIGLGIGLSASGMYSGFKALASEEKTLRPEPREGRRR